MTCQTIRRGILTIGIDASAPGPFHSAVPGTPWFTGFDIDMTSEIARLLSLTPHFTENLWSSIFQALHQRQFDLVCTACTITEERRKIVDFSEPYFDTELVLVTRKGFKVSCLEDPQVKKIAVRITTVAEEVVRARAKAKLILTYDFNEDAYNALVAGEADAVIDDAFIAPHFVPERPLIRVAGPVPNTKFQYGMMFSKGNDALREAVNQALATIKTNTTYDQIYKRWFGKNH